MPKIIKFNPVLRGDTIGIHAPSAALEHNKFKEALNKLESDGYKTKIAFDPSAAYGKSDHMFAAASLSERVRTLHALFRDRKVKAILTARGGYGAMEMLPHLDYALLRKNPKPLIGFSDVTALLNAIYQKSGLLTVHAASLSTFSYTPDHDNFAADSCEALLELLRTPGYQTFKGSYSAIKKGSGKGRLIGGNLSVLVSLLGTAWAPRLKDTILFLEETGESPYRIHRMLLQLQLATNFKDLKGVVLGSFHGCVHKHGSGPDVEMVFSDIFKGVRFPVIKGVPIGHHSLNLPIPVGIMAEIRHNELEFLESPIIL